MSAELRRMDDERMASLETKVNLWMQTTEDYRKALCFKLDKLLGKIESLQCPARVEVTNALKRDIDWLQRITYSLCIAIPVLAVAWGGIIVTVTRNTEKVERHESSIMDNAKDIRELRVKHDNSKMPEVVRLS